MPGIAILLQGFCQHPLYADKMRANQSNSSEGLVFAFLGILMFSVSLPATRLAVPELGSVFVGLGRAIVAGILAGLLLWLRREPFPKAHQRLPLLISGLGVVIGFPLLTALALQHLPAIHGVVITGLLPACTAMIAVLRGHERVNKLFWLAVALGVFGVLMFAFVEGAGTPKSGDALLFGAVLLCALGYSEGGRLAKTIDGWRVISWSLVFWLPVVLIVVLLFPPKTLVVSSVAWLGFLYLSVFSMFIGFFAWYRGLALYGIARASQLQLLQPVFSMAWAVLLLGERIKPQTVWAAAIVIASVALSRLAISLGVTNNSPA